MRFPARGFWIAAWILLAAALGRRAVQKAAPRADPAGAGGSFAQAPRPGGGSDGPPRHRYAGWLIAAQSRQTTEVARAMTGGDPERAPPLLRRYGCSGCHAIPGVPERTARSAVAGRVEEAGLHCGHPPQCPRPAVDWIVSPPSFSPRTAMPVTGISREEARDVAAFLYGR